MPSLATAWKRIQQVVGPFQRNPRLFLIVVFLFALTLRLFAMFATSAYHIDRGDDHFAFGWEMGRVARSLVEGRGFSSPMPSPTGPTAIVGPVYPLFLALIFKVLGIYSTASAVAILTFQCVFSSLTCFFVYLCGRDTLGKAAGTIAALAWALFPLNIFFTLTRIWETSITALLAAALFWYMLPLRDSVSVLRWSKTGVLLAIVTLINTSLVVIAVPFLLSAMWTNRARIVRPAIAAVLMFAALVSPWLIRNYFTFGRVMLRSNFALEFRVGNNEWSLGQKVEELHPARSSYLNQRWYDLGERRFLAEESDVNSRFVAAHPSLFAFATLNRIVNYWSGAWITPTKDYPNSWSAIIGTSILSLLGLLGVCRMFYIGDSVAFMYAGCLFLYPLPYYITTSQPRFYHSITPLLILSGVFWVVNWRSRRPLPTDCSEAVTAEAGASKRCVNG
jgi:hypothetical protein